MKPDIVACILIMAPLNAETPRDPWLHPFDSHSIWNMPLGSEAKAICMATASSAATVAAA